MHQAIPLVVFFIALAIMYVILSNGLAVPSDLKTIFVVICILAIAGLSIFGLFEESFMKYIFYSTAIQFSYFALDVGTAFLIGKSVWFAILQFINFGIAGGLFAIAMTLLYNKLKAARVRDYAGLYDNNQFLVLVLAISCLSLGGMPGFNIFVGEYLIYASLFTIHPALTLGAVFAGLVCFLFYFRICYVLFAGKTNTEIQLGIVSKTILALLSLLVILLGIIPHILLTILEWYI